MHIYPADSTEKLEFGLVKKAITEFCRNPAAARRIQELIPQEEAEYIQTLLQQTKEYLSVLSNGLYFPDPNCEDISRELSMLAVPGSVLFEKQFMDIKAVADGANALIEWLGDKADAYPALHACVTDIPLENDISNEIDKVLDAHGIVRSNASHELSAIRKELAVARREHERLFNHALNKQRKAGILADTGETFINGRRVLSVLSENKREIKGIIHGYSKTGKATYIEPAETVESGNDITLLESEEKREIHRILRELTHTIRSRKHLLDAYFELLVHMETTRSKAAWGNRNGACVPIFGKKSGIRLVHALHPVLAEKNQKLGKPTIPLDLILDTKKSIIIISGPNAGGKSISLKTVGLLQLMIQSGIPVTCDERSEFGYFRNLLTDIGDSQSIEYELSTYSSRLIKMKHFLQKAGKSTLFLIDEFGTGSDPELGGAMAEVILEELAASRAFGIITTHYGNIKVAGESLESVENACMLFDDDTLKPMYKLETGKPGSSYTFAVAEKSGLGKHLIARAKDKVDGEKIRLDTILNSLQFKRNKLNEELKTMQRKVDEAEKARKEFAEEKEKLSEKLSKLKLSREEDQKLMELGRRMKALTEEWEEEKDKKKVIAKFVKLAGWQKAKIAEEKEKFKKANTREKIIAKKLAEISVGSSVRMKGSNEIGKVQHIKGSKAKVLFGIMVTEVSVENLEVFY